MGGTEETRAVPETGTWGERGLCGAGLGVILGFFLWCGFEGIEFGRHWDEERHLRGLAQSIKSGVLLPGDYSYGSVSFWLGQLAVVKHREQLEAYIRGEPRAPYEVVVRDVTLTLRGIFLMCSSLSLVWLFLAIRAAGGRPLAALLGAGLFAASFEVSYHARWVAPDMVLVQWATLCLWLVLRGARGGGRAWLWLDLAAVAAGLGCGTKYPGGLLLLLPLLGGWLAGSADTGGSSRVRRATRTALLFAVAYLASTPGTVLEPRAFARDVGHELWHYGTGHPGHTIEAGTEHLLASLRYLGLHLAAPWPVLAAVLAGSAVLGLAILVVRRPATGVLVLLHPVLAVAFMSQQRVFMVRNLLVVAPLLAVGFALALSFVLDRLPSRGRRLLAGTLALGLLAPGAWFVADAARSITEVKGQRPDAAAVATLAGAGDLSEWMLSRGVRALIGRAAEENPAGANRAMILLSEVQDPAMPLPATAFDLVLGAGGPRDVNLSFYPGWLGQDRVLVLDAPRVRELEHPAFAAAPK